MVSGTTSFVVTAVAQRRRRCTNTQCRVNCPRFRTPVSAGMATRATTSRSRSLRQNSRARATLTDALRRDRCERRARTSNRNGVRSRRRCARTDRAGVWCDRIAVGGVAAQGLLKRTPCAIGESRLLDPSGLFFALQDAFGLVLATPRSHSPRRAEPVRDQWSRRPRRLGATTPVILN